LTAIEHDGSAPCGLQKVPICDIRTDLPHTNIPLAPAWVDNVDLVACLYIDKGQLRSDCHRYHRKNKRNCMLRVTRKSSTVRMEQHA
jgi:hypothetical protein